MVLWYYARGQEQLGPVDEAVFQQLIATGEITPQTLVWHDGMPNWLPYAQLETSAAAAPEFAEPVSPLLSPTATASTGAQFPCAECGRVFPAQDMVEYQGQHICAQCKPLYFQRIREGVPIGMDYAGFWIRGGAFVLDNIILFIVYIVISFLIGMIAAVLAPATAEEGDLVAAIVLGGLSLLQIFWYVFYETWFVGRFGATPGKMACGLKVVRADGSPVTYLRALGRFFAKMLSGLILYIGYIIAAFDDQKRTLHDHICDTRVIRR